MLVATFTAKTRNDHNSVLLLRLCSSHCACSQHIVLFGPDPGIQQSLASHKKRRWRKRSSRTGEQLHHWVRMFSSRASPCCALNSDRETTQWFSKALDTSLPLQIHVEFRGHGIRGYHFRFGILGHRPSFWRMRRPGNTSLQLTVCRGRSLWCGNALPSRVHIASYALPTLWLQRSSAFFRSRDSSCDFWCGCHRFAAVGKPTEKWHSS